MDEIQSLIMRVEGEEKLKSLNAQLGIEDDMLRKLVALQAAGATGVNPAAVQAAAAQVVNLNKEIESLRTSTMRFSGGAALQLQYVMDDLINTSGNWSRHLAAISNNIPGVVLSLGGGAGLAGTIGMVTTAIIALTPVITSAWTALMNEAPETAKERLKELEAQAKKTHDVFMKLAGHATQEEREEAENVQAIFEDRPNAEKTAQGLAAGFGKKEIEKAIFERKDQDGKLMFEDKKNEFLKTGIATWTDQDIENEASEHNFGLFSDDPMERQKYIAQKERERDQAQNVRARIDREVRQRLAEELIVAAKTGGAEGNSARGRIGRAAAARPDEFPRDLAADLEDASVAGQRRIDAANDEHAEALQQRREAVAARNARNRDSRQLMAQGEQNKEWGERTAEHQKTQEEHDKARAAQETARRLQQTEREQKEAPVHEAQAAITKRSRNMGVPFTESRSLEAARAAVEMTQQGIGAQQALTLAMQAQINKMQRLGQQYAELQAEAQRLQMGPDFTGQFSQMAPWSPGPY